MKNSVSSYNFNIVSLRMFFSEVVGLNPLKNFINKNIVEGRVPHAQLFVGPHGRGALPMAIAYARIILSKYHPVTNNDQSLFNNPKLLKLTHPDLHFVFPVATNDKIKKHPVSDKFMDEWRSFLLQDPYRGIFDWYRTLGIENKQGQIGVDEALEIVKKVSLKSYEGGYKVTIIWMAEKMNTAASNKLLKIIEEPPEKTLFILLAEDESQILQTIRSRCQILYFPPLKEDEIKSALIKEFECNEKQAFKLAQQANGSYAKAKKSISENQDDEVFEQWFVAWVRTAFRAKNNKASILDLIQWSETVAKSGREVQKHFLRYCLTIFRQALLLNYGAKRLVFLEFKTSNFKFESFSKFIHGANIIAITAQVEDAIYHIERNGNAKIVFTDLSIKLTRLLHRKGA